jgi:hypothetical protein
MYLLQTNGAYRYLFMALECFPRTNVLTWANSVLDTYSNHLAIIITHSFLDRNNTRLIPGGYYAKASYTFSATDGTDAQEMWDFCFKQHPNVILILNGHQITGNTARLASYGTWGNQVNQLFSNWQYEGPTAAWIRLMRFRPGANRIDVSTYEPIGGTWRTNYENQFSIPMVGPPLDLAQTAQPAFDPINEGLRLKYTFDEGNGIVATDTSGYQNNGIFTNFTGAPGVSWGSGTNAKAGYSMGFAGSNLVWIESSASLTNFGTNLTVACWFKPNPANPNTNGPALVAKHNQSTDGEWLLRISTNATPNDSIQAYLINASGTRVTPLGISTGTNLVAEGKWHHAAFTYDGAQVVVYLDGVPVAVTNQTGNVKNTTWPVNVGSYANATMNPDVTLMPLWYSGNIDDLRIWARTLRPDEIATLAAVNPTLTRIATNATPATNFTMHARAGVFTMSSNSVAAVVTNNFCSTNTVIDACINDPVGWTNTLRCHTTNGLIRFQVSGTTWAPTRINWRILTP